VAKRAQLCRHRDEAERATNRRDRRRHPQAAERGNRQGPAVNDVRAQIHSVTTSATTQATLPGAPPWWSSAISSSTASPGLLRRLDAACVDPVDDRRPREDTGMTVTDRTPVARVAAPAADPATVAGRDPAAVVEAWLANRRLS